MTSTAPTDHPPPLTPPGNGTGPAALAVSLVLGLGGLFGLGSVGEDLVQGFLRGMKTARTSPNYRGLELPDPISEAMGVWTLPVAPEDEVTVGDAGLVIAPDAAPGSGLLILPVHRRADQSPLRLLEHLAEVLQQSLFMSQDKLSTSRPRDLGNRADLRMKGTLDGRPVEGEIWYRPDGPVGLAAVAWAPESGWDRQRARLEGLLDRTHFDPTRTLPIQSVGDGTTPVPPGWSASRTGRALLIQDPAEPGAWVRIEDVPPLAGTEATPSLADELIRRLQKDGHMEDMTLIDSHPYPYGQARDSLRCRSVSLEAHQLRGGREFRLVASLHHIRGAHVDLRRYVIRRYPEDLRFTLSLMTALIERGARPPGSPVTGRRGPCRLHPAGSHPVLLALVESEYPSATDEAFPRGEWIRGVGPSGDPILQHSRNPFRSPRFLQEGSVP